MEAQKTSRILLVAAALLWACWGAGAAFAQKIVLNEVFRGTDFGPAGTEWVEMVVLEDLSAAELETYYLGDTNNDGLGEKAASLRFANMDAIAPAFPAGTMFLVVGGAVPGFPEDVSFDFSGGDRLAVLDANGTHFVRRGALDLTNREIVWVDIADAPSDALTADGFGVQWGAVDPGSVLGASVGTVIPAPPNNGPGSSGLATELTLAAVSSQWVEMNPETPGAGNGGANTASLQKLPVELSAFALE